MAEALTLFALGIVIGGVLGALGGGGSILAVPALVYVGHQSAQAATSASLVVVGVGALGGLVPHLQARRVRAGAGLTFGAVGILGSIAGTRLNRAVDDQVLIAAFVALLIVVGILMLKRPVRSLEGDGQARPGRVVLAGTAVGFLTGFLGVGGGFVVVPALVLALGFSMPTAVGTSLVVIVVNAIVALAARAGSLDVPWAMTVALAAGTTLGSLVMGRLAHRWAPERLTSAFAGLLLVIAAVMAASVIG